MKTMLLRAIGLGVFAVVGLASDMPAAYGKSPPDDPSFRRLSTHWSRGILPVVDGVVTFGDGKLDASTVRLLVAMADRQIQCYPQSTSYAETSLWNALASMFVSLDRQRDGALLAELIQRAKADKEHLEAAIFLARFESPQPNFQARADLASLWQKVEAIRRGARVSLDNDKQGRAAVYLAVVTGATWEGIRPLAENPALRPFVVDACSVNRITPEVRDSLIARVLASGDRRSQALLVNLILQKESAEVQSLLVKLMDTLPQETVNGQRCLVIGTGTLEERVSDALFRGRDIAGLKERYDSHKARNQLDVFFRMEEKNGDMARVKGWLLYRYHAAEFSMLLDDMKASSPVMLGERWYLAAVLKPALRCVSLVSPQDKRCRFVRDFAAQAKSPESQVNSLILLESIANNADIPLLCVRAAEGRELTWKSSGQEHVAPLVAFQAIHCLTAIRSPVSLQALKRIAEDASVPTRARDLARKRVTE